MDSPIRFRRYRSKADLCERVSQAAGDESQGRLWLALRDSYAQLAEALDRHAHRRWREEEG